MKKSYKIFGIFWDRLNVDNDFTITNENVLVLNHTVEENLMDLGGYYARKIDFSELLKIENESDFSNIIKDVQNCDTIYINIDYMPHNLNDTVKDFLKLRLSQIVYRIRLELPNVSIKVFDKNI